MTRKHEHLKVLYLKAFEFIQLFVNSVKENEKNDLQSALLEFDIFVLDDFDQFSNKDQTQHFLTNIIDNFIDNGKQVIISTSTSIIEDSCFASRLRSKLSKGLMLTLDVPDNSIKLSFIQSKLQQNYLNISNEKIVTYSEAVYSSFNEIEGAIMSLIIQEKFQGSK